MQSLEMSHVVTAANYDEAAYLAANPDVAEALMAGNVSNGRQHFDLYGIHEGRRARATAHLPPLRQTKLDRLLPVLRLDLPHVRRDDKFDFLTAELRQEGAIVDTHNVASNPYSPAVLAMIARCSDGLVLDCGAGLRDIYFDNVVNYEIVDYDTTDVRGGWANSDRPISGKSA
jgi:hypothetical protein